MNNKSEFENYVIEIFSEWAPVQSRKMFGGYGLYREGLMFALISDDVLYLKSDAVSCEKFIERGLPPFEYIKAGKVTKVSYYQAPEEIFDDSDMANAWGEMAFQSALNRRR